MEELNYPELPEGYVWKKRGEAVDDDGANIPDIDIWQEGADSIDTGLVA